MQWLHESKTKFIAKTITDVGKALIVMGLAGYFFERYPLGFRILFSVLSFGLVVFGVIIYPTGGKE